MANLFTRFLTRRNKNHALSELVTRWDSLEILVITVYKSQTVTEEDLQTYATLRPWFVKHYPAWEKSLEPLWRPTLVGGKRAPEDPFRRIFSAETANHFLTDWVAMQNLAAAREALNKLVLAQNSKT